MSVEEKARREATDAFLAKRKPLDDNDLMRMYIAGHAEALRWRDPVEEPPSDGEEVLIATDDSTLAFAIYEGMFLGGMGFRAPNGGWANATRWRPIGPLPEAL